MIIIIIYSSYKEKRCLNLPPLSEADLLHRGSGRGPDWNYIW